MSLLKAAAVGSVNDCIDVLSAGFQSSTDINEALFCASRSKAGDRVRCIKLLLLAKADVEAENESGLRPLHAAALTGHGPNLEVLASQKADVDSLTNEGWTALHMASENCDNDIINLLFAMGANLDAPAVILEQTALHLVSCLRERCRQRETLQLLLSLRANVQAKACDNQTPLHWASESGNAATVHCLLLARADVDVQDDEGYTALHKAVWARFTETAHTLLSNGAHVNAKDLEGQTALHMAVEGSHAAMVRVLVSAAADPEAVEMNGLAPLHRAACRGNVFMIKTLLGLRADTSFKAHGLTALHLASFLGLRSSVGALLQEDPDVDAQTEDGDGRAACAAAARRYAAVSPAADLPAITEPETGLPYSHICAHESFQNQSAEEMRCEFYALEATTWMDGTALHLAAVHGHRENAIVLLNFGADFQAKTQSGYVPLHLASSHGHRCIVELLLGLHADPAVQDDDGRTAHDMATGAVKSDTGLMLQLVPRPTCPRELGLAFVATLGLPDDLCFDHNYDRCYCLKCYPATFSSTINDESGSTSVVPRGWFRVGIRAEKKWALNDIFNSWSVSYHGVKSASVLRSIFQHGSFLIPGEAMLDGNTLNSKKCAGRQDHVFYTSPTVRYAGLKFYAEPQSWTAPEGTPMMASIVLQCRQKPGTFERQAETMRFESAWPGHLRSTCPHVDLAAIEWKSKQKEGAIPYGLLVRIWRQGADQEADYYKSPVD